MAAASKVKCSQPRSLIIIHNITFSDNIRFDRCTERELGGSARVTVCHCDTDGCNLAEISRARARGSWWDVFSLLDTRV